MNTAISQPASVQDAVTAAQASMEAVALNFETQAQAHKQAAEDLEALARQVRAALGGAARLVAPAPASVPLIAEHLPAAVKVKPVKRKAHAPSHRDIFREAEAADGLVKLPVVTVETVKRVLPKKGSFRAAAVFEALVKAQGIDQRKLSSKEITRYRTFVSARLAGSMLDTGFLRKVEPGLYARA